MLRSFSYAAYAGLFAHAATRPAEFGRLEPWAHIWQTWASAAFLRGYFETAGERARSCRPISRNGTRCLRLFMLDKALYELNYELNNRPDWVRIPLWGIFDLALTTGQSGPAGRPVESTTDHMTRSRERERRDAYRGSSR